MIELWITCSKHDFVAPYIDYILEVPDTILQGTALINLWYIQSQYMHVHQTVSQRTSRLVHYNNFSLLSGLIIKSCVHIILIKAHDYNIIYIYII